MKTLYLDCSMGAAGDMLTAALLELLPDPDSFINKINSLSIPDVEFTASKTEKCGISGTKVTVKVKGTEESIDNTNHTQNDSHHHDHDNMHVHKSGHHHSSMEDIQKIIEGLPLKECIKNNILSVYSIIAEAESKVHGVPVTDIHFHEVGTMDAIGDITAVCMLMDELAPEYISASPVHVGSGQITCAHGILPVPAPAAAEILKNIPVYGTGIKGELCTPTGAALLKFFVEDFKSMPQMIIKNIGYGMGKKDFEAANCIRAILGETEDSGDKIAELSCNIDDMSAEDISFAIERIFDCGALDVYTVPIGMKKSRPGTMLCVICAPDDIERTVKTIFRHTTTLGIRKNLSERYTMKRKSKYVDTAFGKVRLKESNGYGVNKYKYEYEDISKIAKENNLSLSDVRNMINKETT